MPPNEFMAKFRVASVVAADGVGAVVAQVLNVTTGAPKAAVAGFIGPSELGAAKAVGAPTSRALVLAKVQAATTEVELVPDTSISRMSVTCPAMPPFTAMN
jgi:hypothetical protein